MFDGQVERFISGGPRLDLLEALAERLDRVDPKGQVEASIPRPTGVRTDLLNLLADRLDRVEPARFNIGQWFYSSSIENLESSRPGDCGTVACAIGYATEMDEFKRAGLRLVRFKYKQRFSIYPVLKRDGRNLCAEHAISVLFGMNRDEVESLFYPGPAATTPQGVAERIREFIQTVQQRETASCLIE